MYKKLIALSFVMLLAMSGISSGASTTTEYDPYNLYFWYVNSADEAVVYNYAEMSVQSAQSANRERRR